MAAMEAFVRVIDAGSFSGAAKQLRLGQSAISKTIAQLEDRLGFFAVRPNLVVIPLSVSPHDRLKDSPFKPAYKQFGIVLIVADGAANIRGIEL